MLSTLRPRLARAAALALASLTSLSAARERPLGATGRVTRLEADVRVARGESRRLLGTVVVGRGATLTLEAGAQLTAEPGARLVVDRDGRLVAVGTPLEPVELACVGSAGATGAGGGCWTGLTILGNARVSGGAGASPAIAGRAAGGCPELAAAAGAFGGCADDDSSGVLRWVRVRSAGVAPGAAVELLGVGARTVFEHLYVLGSAEDGVRVRGGTARLRWVRVMNAARSALAWADGWRGRLQFAALQAGSAGGPAVDGANAATDYDAEPRSSPVLHNVTVVGPPAPDTADLDAGAVRLRAGTAGALRGLLVLGRPSLRRAGIDVDDDATWAQVVAGALVVERSMLVGYAPVGDQDTDPDLGGQYRSPDVEGQWVRDTARANVVLDAFGSADSTLRAAWAQLADLRPRPERAVLTLPCAVPAPDAFFESTSYCGALGDGGFAVIPWLEPSPIFDASPAPPAALGLLVVAVTSPERGPLGGVRLVGDMLAGTDAAGLARTYAPSGMTPMSLADLPPSCEGPGVLFLSVPQRAARSVTISVTCTP